MNRGSAWYGRDKEVCAAWKRALLEGGALVEAVRNNNNLSRNSKVSVGFNIF